MLTVFGGAAYQTTSALSGSGNRPNRHDSPAASPRSTWFQFSAFSFPLSHASPLHAPCFRRLAFASLQRFNPSTSLNRSHFQRRTSIDIEVRCLGLMIAALVFTFLRGIVAPPRRARGIRL